MAQRIDPVGVAGAAGAIIAVGGSVAVSGLITEYPVYAGQSVRYFGAFAILAAAALVRRLAWPRLTLRDAGMLVGLAFTGMAAFNVAIVIGLKHAEPAVFGVVVGAVPIVLAVVGPKLEGRPISRRVLLGAVVVTIGAAIVTGAGRTNLLGFALAVVALAGEALFSLFAIPVLPRLRPYFLTVYVTLLAALMLGIGAIIDRPADPFPAPTAEELWAYVYLAVVVTAVAFIAWYTGVERLGIELAGLFAGLLPVATLFIAVPIGTGDVSALKLLGVLVVAVGITAGLWSNGKVNEQGAGSGVGLR